MWSISKNNGGIVETLTNIALKHALATLSLACLTLSTALYFIPHEYQQSIRASSSHPEFYDLNIPVTWDTSPLLRSPPPEDGPPDMNPGSVAAIAPPQISWFLSYPGSGTEYINYLVQEVSHTTTATNYGFLSAPFAADLRNGPFAHNDLPHPPRSVLTTTYCGGFCVDCDRGAFIPDREDFRDACATGLLLNGHERSVVRYDPDAVGKGVHLIRDPVENIVARFLDEYEMRTSRGDKDWLYNSDEFGFRQWCRDVDQRLAGVEPRMSHPDVVELMQSIPCAGIFYQYALWHNNVAEVLAQYGHRFRMLTLKYEDFDTQHDEAIKQLFEFLELPIVGRAPRFPLPLSTTAPRTKYFYKPNEITAISSFLKVVSSQPTWIAIRDYLPPPVDETSFSALGSVLSPVHYGTWPEIAWLLSFPNSGTFFTTQFTQVRSRAAIATNYANEVGKNFDFIPHFGRTENGPFRYSMRPFSETYILTKTHCVGHCIECSPERYVRTPEEFVKGCAKGGKYVERYGNLVKVFYDPNVARKTVHLVRDPFDNIVARFHFTYKEHKTHSDVGWSYPYDKNGFKAWCQYMDARYPSKESQYFTQEILDAIQDVPCHGEFYQYIQWHNNALTVPNALKIPSLVLYYEDFHYSLDEKMNGLLDFLELPKVGKVTEFKWKGGYDDHFTPEERVAIQKFIKMMATPEAWQMLERYFNPDVARSVGWHDYFKTPPPPPPQGP